MAWPSTQPSLLSRLRDVGDHEAWSTFEGRYGDLIVRYCRRRGLQFSDAEDVRQIVLISLSKAMRSFKYDRPRGRFRSYLACVVRNAISRAAKCPDSIPIALPFVVENVNNETAIDDACWDQEWMDHHLRRAMRTVRLSLRSQSAMVFERLLSGGTVADAAREFDVTVEAVKKIRQRVRGRLKQEIIQQIEEEDLCA